MSLNIDYEALLQWGWSPFFEKQLSKQPRGELKVARIISIEKNYFLLEYGITRSAKPSLAVLSGKLFYEIQSGGSWPAVGDWVFAQMPPGGDGHSIICEVFDRFSLLRRKVAGTRHDEQILAANFETVLITSSMNEDLNLRRIERYLMLGWDSGAEPVILLTKSDLTENPLRILEEISGQFPGVKVEMSSIYDSSSYECLKKYFSPGKTAVIVGSSGVGKSSLVNLLCGSALMKTQEIRESDARGKHTTTSRHLMRTKWEGLIIDTPGMREIQLLDHDEGFEREFSDIEELKLNCRFFDCSHITEPGCQIKQATEAGGLDQERWKSYLKLQRELRHYERKKNKQIASEDKKKWKKMHKDYEQRKKLD